MTLRGFRDEALGVALTIDERFLDVGSASDGESPSAHLLASEPGEGWIAAPADDGGLVPASLVEHWTVLVEERRWLLAMELMVQPPERWDAERVTLEFPFRTLELI